LTSGGAARLHRRSIHLRARWQRADQVGDGPPAEALDPAPHQRPEHRRRRLGVAEGGVDRLQLDLERLHQPGQARGLTGR
jgi:hypothetical protein